MCQTLKKKTKQNQTKLVVCERMAMKRRYLGKQKAGGETMPPYWTTNGESRLQLLIAAPHQATWSKCICVYFTFSFPVVQWEIEENEHSNNDGAGSQLAQARVRGRKNIKSAHSLVWALPVLSRGPHLCVLKELIHSPGHRGQVLVPLRSKIRTMVNCLRHPPTIIIPPSRYLPLRCNILFNSHPILCL